MAKTDLKINGGYALPDGKAPKAPTPEGKDLSMLSRLVTGVKFMITGKGLESDAVDEVPFGPSQPIRPVFQEGMAGRQFDYQTAINISYVPRAEEPISFLELRALAERYDLLRLAIETCKDQITKVSWTTVPRDGKAKPDATCKQIDDFFRYPDRDHDWQTWLRALMEDLLVIDAPTLYPRLTKGGDLYSLELMDGALIKRVIDGGGRTPAAPNPAYQQYIKGVPAVDYTADQLIYRPRNVRTNKVYGYGPVEQVIMTVNIAIRRQLHQLSYYTDGNMPDLLFQVPDTWNPDQITQFQLWWDSLHAGNVAERRKGKFVPAGVAPYDVKQAALKDDYDEWLARIICYCFSLPVTSFIKQMNRATADNQKSEASEQGIVPRLEWTKGMRDYVINKHFNRPDLHSIYEIEKNVDPLVQAQIDQIYLGAGGIPPVMSPDEIRERQGFEGPAPVPPPPPAPFGGGDAPKNDVKGAGNPKEPKPGMTKNGSDDKGKVLTADDMEYGRLERKIDKAVEIIERADAKRVEKKIDRVQRTLATTTQPDVKRRKKNVKPINRNRPAIAEARKEIGAVMGKVFRFAASDVTSQIRAAIGKTKRADAEGERLIAQILAELDFQGWSITIDPVKEVLERVYKEGGAAALMQINFDSSEGITKLLDDRAAAYAERRAAELVGMRNIGTKEDPEWVENPDAKWAITQTTRENLRSTVTDAVNEGWSNQRLKDEIEGSESFSASRAETVARTETAFADSAGNMAAYRASGVVMGKQWIVGSNHEDIDDCDDNVDAGVIGLDEPFPSGDDASPAHPRCVCDVIPVVMEAEGDDEENDGERLLRAVVAVNDAALKTVEAAVSRPVAMPEMPPINVVVNVTNEDKGGGAVTRTRKGKMTKNADGTVSFEVVEDKTDGND